MNTSAQPTLWVFAGPNGAGKTTLFDEILRGKVPFVNADEIARTLEPSSGNIDVLQAGRRAVERRNLLLGKGESLSIETTLSGNSALAFMRRARALRYHISLAYVGIETPELSRARIDERVLQGGHDVPQDAVIRRHPDSMRRLAQAMQIADSSLIFDNSGLERRLLLHVENGSTLYLERARPAWFETAVPERLRRFGNPGNQTLRNDRDHGRD